MTSPSIADQFAAGAALEFGLHFLQQWSKTPWITVHTTKITTVFRIVLAFFATIGLQWHYATIDGGTLTVTGLSVSVVAAGLWHLFRQYALQHGFGHLIRNGNLDAFQQIVQNVVTQAIKENALKSAPVLLLCLALAVFPALSHAQTTSTPAPAATPLQNFYAAAISGNTAGSPAIAGTALYAHLVDASSGTYAFTAYDALPTNLKPLTVTSNVSAGVAQKLFTVGKISIYSPLSAGFSWQGQNAGWFWSGGAMAPIKLKGSWYLAPILRFGKSNVSNGTGYQLMPGLGVAWGQ